MGSGARLRELNPRRLEVAPVAPLQGQSALCADAPGSKSRGKTAAVHLRTQWYEPCSVVERNQNGDSNVLLHDGDGILDGGRCRDGRSSSRCSVDQACGECIRGISGPLQPRTDV